MDKKTSIEILKGCIDFVDSLSEQEFDEILKLKDIQDKSYDGNYVDELFILPGELSEVSIKSSNFPRITMGTRKRNFYKTIDVNNSCDSVVQANEGFGKAS